MKLGIMQPYLFPYLGYFQLIAAVDTFVLYDDVNYIKQGWINRNNILVGGQKHIFTVPLQGASSFAPINETLINASQYSVWRSKFLKTLAMSYKKAPCYQPIADLAESVFNQEVTTIGGLATASISAVASYLQLPTRLVMTSATYNNAELKATERILDICQREQAQTYINTVAGQELYSKEVFASHSINLAFLRPREINYAQLGNAFVPNLSILDVLMFNSREQVLAFLQAYDLL